VRLSPHLESVPAVKHYTEIIAVDPQFRDVAKRLQVLNTITWPQRRIQIARLLRVTERSGNRIVKDGQAVRVVL